VLANPAATLGVDVTLPFLGFNPLMIKLKSARVDYEKAAVDFRQSLLSAFKDVDNALSSATELARQAERQQSVVRDAQRAADLYELRYRSGGTSFRVWLDAQQQARSLQQALAQIRLSLLTADVTTYQALGGGVPLSAD